MQAQSNIYLIGMTGCGKSTVGRALSEQLCRRYYDTDEEIIRLTGKNIHTLLKTEGEGVFRHQEGRVIRGLSAMQNIVAALGSGAMSREVNRARLSISGRIIWLDVAMDVLMARLKQSSDHPLLGGLSNEKMRETLNRLFDARRHNYASAHIHLKFTDETPVAAIVSQILKAL